MIAVSAAACQAQEAPAQAQPAAAPAPAPLTPEQKAQQLVATRLGAAQQLSFSDAQVFTSAGATVVCGRYQVAGAAPQRYITVGDEDVFVEGEYQGDIGEAVAETCRNS